MQWVLSTLIANAIVTVVLAWLLKWVARRFFRLEVLFRTTYLPVFAGNYLAYYAGLRDFLRGQADAPPVTPEQVYRAMQLLTLGEHSAQQGRFLPVDPIVPL